MNDVRTRLVAILGIALTAVLSGCATHVEVTHAYPGYVQPPKAEAIRLISAQKFGELFIFADETRCSFKSYDQIVDHTEPASWNTVKVYYHYGYLPAGGVDFADITRIQLLKYSDHCAIRLCRKGEKGDWGGWMLRHIKCENNPEKYNELLSAFLLLCPNVK